MIKYYTGLGHFKLDKDRDHQGTPMVIYLGKEYCMTTAEMIVWNKCTWNICSEAFLHKAFVIEEKLLGKENFDFELNRLVQRGLILQAEAETDSEALHQLMDDLVVIPADFSFSNKLIVFLAMVFRFKVPIRKAKEVFKPTLLTEYEEKFLLLAKQFPLTVRDIGLHMDVDDTKFLIALIYLYTNKHISFCEDIFA